MQIHALDETTRIVTARQAIRHRTYYCFECQEAVKVRQGLHRQAHFYHLSPNRHCSQHRKSAIHLQLQQRFLHLLPPGECQLERPFKRIHRIADVVWEPQKIVFEIQCSPISLEEVQKRNADYASLGYQVVWILHTKTFNQQRLSAAELYLRTTPCY